MAITMEAVVVVLLMVDYRMPDSQRPLQPRKQSRATEAAESAEQSTLQRRRERRDSGERAEFKRRRYFRGSSQSLVLLLLAVDLNISDLSSKLCSYICQVIVWGELYFSIFGTFDN